MMTYPFPLALCNEMFEGVDPIETAQRVASFGYTALEIAPFTLGDKPLNLPDDEIKRLRSGIEAAGLRVLGLHWLLAKTTGLHAAGPDPAVRQRTVEYLTGLARLCASFGGSVLVFGSPQQRSTPPGETREDTLKRFKETLSSAAEAARREGAVIALEPLTGNETDIVNTAAKAVEIIEGVNHPALKLHLDAKAMQAEDEPREEVIRKHGSHLVSFHANDPNKLGPGMGDLDLLPSLRALREVGYKGFLSVEVFDFSPGPDNIARESAEYLKNTMAKI